MIGSAFFGESTRYHFADPAVQDGWDWIEGVFGYQRVEFVSAPTDYTKFIVQVLGPKSGYGYYLADTKEHLTWPIGTIYDDVQQIAEVRPIKYAAADGLEIPAYLTLPPGWPANNLPIIVFPHVAPKHATYLSSTGRHRRSRRRDTLYCCRTTEARISAKKVGRIRLQRMGSQDANRPVGRLPLPSRRTGIADPKRACVVGASYGGYTARAGVAIQSGIYRCAVAVAGISDLSNFMRWVMCKEQYDGKVRLRHWQRFLGVDNPGDKRLDEISPLRHVDQITVPLMLIHGRDDTTVPYDQSADLVEALKRLGLLAKFVMLDKDEHYLFRTATRLQMLQSSVEFLRKHNPPD